MSTKNRKLQVFVSSTFTDLRAERQAAVEAILSTGNIPAGMELFSAGDQSQMEVIKEWIQESDVYLLILGGRYGTIEPVTGKSYTQLEYEYALEIGKSHFAVVISDKALNEKVKKHGLEMTERGSTEKYNEFKKLVTEAKLVEFWDDLKDVELAIHKSLLKFGKREELVGWVRGDQAVNSGAMTEGFVRLEKENLELKNKVAELERQTLMKGGLTFEELFSLFNNTRISLKHIRNFDLKYSDIAHEESEDIDANSLLILLQYKINGINSYYEEAVSSMLSPYLLHSIITVKEQDHYGDPMDVYYIAKFTSAGISYLFYLIKNHPDSLLYQNRP